MTLGASDALSGVAVTYYTVDGGAAQLYAGGPFLVGGEGSHPVTYWSVDAAGNIEGTHTGYVNIDTTPPVTTASGLQANDHSGWTKTTPQTVSLSASDGGSGMSGGSAATYYTIDGVQHTYSGSFTVSAEGSHTVTYWSVDAVGNIEGTHTGYVNIDLTPPVTTATGLQADNHSGWATTTPQTVSLSASDGGSGMTGGSAATYYTIDGVQHTYSGSFTVSAEGSHTVTYWSVDAAGNIEGTHTGYVNIDLTPPVTTATGLQANDHSGWTKITPQTVTLSASDGGSGMTGGSAATYYTIDGGATQTYGGSSFTVTGEGTHTIVYWSVDAAGNIEGNHAGFVNIDTTPPVTTATGLQLDNHSGWQNTSQTVTLTGNDGSGSGVATVHYTVDGVSHTYTSPFTVSGQGSHPVTYWSVDAAGNTEATNTGYVNIDTTLPTVTSSADSDTAWHNSAVTVTLSPADTGGSGVADTQYRLHGSSTWLEATGNAFVVPAPSDGSDDGVHVYDYQALDDAGNASSARTCTVKIDTQGPVVTPSGLQPDDITGWQTTNQTVSLATSDAGAGPAVTYYTVDGGAQTTYTAPFQVSGNAQHAVVYWATDVLGNVSAPKTGWVNISNPYAQATGVAPDTHSDWQKSGATVTITGSGDHAPFTIYYKVDAGAWQHIASPASVPVSGEGSHTIAFYAVNTVLVQSVQETGYVNIDATAPTTTATGLQANNHSGWQTANQSVTLSATDLVSGVAATTYAVDGGAAQTYTGTPILVSGSGSHTVTYQSVDNAGNTEGTHTGYVNIDTTPPVTTATGLAPDDDSDWTANPSPSVTLSASDGGSGMTGGEAATYYTVDGGDQTTYAGSFTVTGEGSHTVTYWSVDALGNQEATNTGFVNIDTTPPVTTATGLQANNHSGWQNTSQTVTLTGDDGGGSGVTVTHYTIDGVAQPAYSGPFTVSGQGSHPVTYWSVDAAGNTEATNTGYVNIDTTAADRDEQRRQRHRLAQQRRHRHPEPPGQRRLGRGRHPVPPARLVHLARGDRQRLRRAGPVGRLERRRPCLRLPGPGRRRQRQRHRYMHGEDRHPGAGDHRHGPAGQQLLRLAEHQSDGEPERHRRPVRPAGHLLHRRRRLPADLQRTLQRLVCRSEHHRLLVGRRRRQHRGDQHRLREHRHHSCPP